MEILKSSRHSKIAGDFGEALVLYWLSKYGFECARVDHTGIDLIARNPHTDEMMGISVTARTRTPEHVKESITLSTDRFDKAKLACESFGCVPYFAIVLDAADAIRTFLLPMKHLQKICPIKARGAYWKVTEPYLYQYRQDPKVKTFTLQTGDVQWWHK
jgi:hypothetical protein